MNNFSQPLQLKKVSGHICSECSSSFKERSKLKRHIMEVHKSGSSNKLLFSCSFCGAAFKRKEHLKRHLNSKHTNGKFRCPLCPRELLEKFRMKAHLQKYHHLTSCEHCQEFQTKETITTHCCSSQTRAISIGVIYPCDKCKICFLRKEIRTSHHCAKEVDTLSTDLSSIAKLEADDSTSIGKTSSDKSQPESSSNIISRKAHGTPTDFLEFLNFPQKKLKDNSLEDDSSSDLLSIFSNLEYAERLETPKDRIGYFEAPESSELMSIDF